MCFGIWWEERAVVVVGGDGDGDGDGDGGSRKTL